MLTSAIPYWAVIPATGKGQRMQADRPKQYLQLGMKTILEHTLDNLLSHPKISGVVLVLNEDDTYWGQLDYQHEKSILLCTGGEQRFHSVFNGLKALSNQIQQNAIVLIHDAVRPLVLHVDIDRLIAAANLSDDGAILAAPVADTLKVADQNHKIQDTQARDRLWRAFTPQAFQLDIILPALESVIMKGLPVTDDASAMELAGYKPELVLGDHRNIKITHPGDLHLAELLLSIHNN